MNSFYCQRRIEDNTACETQCDHCNGYYKPLAGEGWEESWKAVNKQLPCGVNPQAYRLGWLDGVSESEKHKKEVERLRAIMKLAFDGFGYGLDSLRDKLWDEFKKENNI